MNTRVQVEHCVTEMTTGVDIVKEGIRAAAGDELSLQQDDVVMRGHAIECRINAEDASKNFAPAPGQIGAYKEPSRARRARRLRRRRPARSRPLYDPMVAKLIVWDADREQATQRMLRALSEYEIEGLKTLIPFHEALLRTEQWAKGETCRDLLEDKDVAEDARLPTARAPRTTTRTRPSSRTTPSRSPASASTSRSSARRPAGGAAAAGAGRPPAARRPSAATRKKAAGGGPTTCSIAAAGQHVEGARRAGPRRSRRASSSASSRR